MLFDQNRVDAIIHNWKTQVFSNERIHGVPLRHSTSLKPPIGGFRNLASSHWQLSDMPRPDERQPAVIGDALNHTAIRLGPNNYLKYFDFTKLTLCVSNHVLSFDVNIFDNKNVWLFGIS